MLFALRPTWTSERCGAELALFSFDKLRECVSENKDISFVFPFEGKFDSQKTWRFHYEFSNLCPVLVTRDQAFKINHFLSMRDKIEVNSLENIMKTDKDNGRTFFYNLAKLVLTDSKYTGIGDDESSNGGSPVRPVPTGPVGGSPIAANDLVSA